MNREVDINVNDANTSSASFISTSSNIEDENSILIWDRDINEDFGINFSTNNTNNISLVNEDFIDIDLIPDTVQNLDEEEVVGYEEDDEDEGLPSNEVDHSSETDMNENQSSLNQPELNLVENEDQIMNITNLCESPTNTQPSQHHNNVIFTGEIKSINEYLKEILSHCPKDFYIPVLQTLSNFCYMDVLFHVLMILDKLNSYYSILFNAFNNCTCCYNSQLKSYGSEIDNTENWSCDFFKLSGHQCEACNWNFFVNTLNVNMPEGATIEYTDSISIMSQCGPQDGWLRRFILDRYRGNLDRQRVVIYGVIYCDSLVSNDTSSNNSNHGDDIGNIGTGLPVTNKITVNTLTAITESGFQVNNNPYTIIADNELEHKLSQTATMLIPKSCLSMSQTCSRLTEDYQRIINHSDVRFQQLNVLGQIVATFREQNIQLQGKLQHLKWPSDHHNCIFILSSSRSID